MHSGLAADQLTWRASIIYDENRFLVAQLFTNPSQQITKEEWQVADLFRPNISATTVLSLIIGDLACMRWDLTNPLYIENIQSC